MPKGFFYYDEDEDFEPRIVQRPLGADDEKDEPAASAIAPYDFGTTDAFDTRAYVASLFKTPLFGVPRNDGPENHPVPPVDSSRPRSWKLPGTNIASPTMPGAGTALDGRRRTIFDDDMTPGRIRLSQGAPTAPMSRESHVIEPDGTSIGGPTSVNDEGGFLRKAIGAAALAIGRAVRSYEAGRGTSSAKTDAIPGNERKTPLVLPEHRNEKPAAMPASDSTHTPSDETTEDTAERRSEQLEAIRDSARKRLFEDAGNPILAKNIYREIIEAAEQTRGASTDERRQMRGKTFAHIDKAANSDQRLRHKMRRLADAAFGAAADEFDIEDVVLSRTGEAPSSEIDRVLAEERRRDRSERQRQADRRLQDFMAKHPGAGYREIIATIVAINRETRALPSNAIHYLMPDLAARDRTMSSRLANPERVLTQLEALHAIAESEAATESLPQSLRDLADDYAAVLRDPNHPRDAEQFVHAIFRHGVPRRVDQTMDLAESVAEIATPYGNIVSLNDARRAAANAYAAFASGRNLEGAKQSAEAVWNLAMAAPLVGNVRRAAKGIAGTKTSASNISEEKLARQRRQLAANMIEGAAVQKFVFDKLREDLKRLGLPLVQRQHVRTKHGATVLDAAIEADPNCLLLRSRNIPHNIPGRSGRNKRSFLTPTCSEAIEKPERFGSPRYARGKRVASTS